MNTLLLVDIQRDFLPGGSLGVAGGDRILPIVNQLLTYPFDRIVATKDWHPPGHHSFASTHGTKPREKVEKEIFWPDHCVQGTAGAEFPPGLEIEEGNIQVIYKGKDLHIDSYSGFYDNERKRDTGLHGYLQENDVDTIYVVGLTTDYCVKDTVLDGLRLGYTVYVIPEGCCGIEAQRGDVERAWEAMREADANILPFTQIQKIFGVQEYTEKD